MSYGTSHWGRFDSAGDQPYLFAPKDWKPSAKRLVVYCHGYGGSSQSAFDPSGVPGQYALVRAIAEAGYPVIAANLGGTATWGYDPVRADVTALLSDQSIGALFDKVAIVGTSMGGLSALVWAASNIAKTTCVVGVGPVNDLQDIVTNNRGGFAASVNGAYPGGYSDATYGATFNPTVIAAAAGYGSLPIQVWYGDSDTIVVPATVTNFASKVGATCETHVLSGGHAESTWQQVDTAAVVAFIAAHT